MNENGVSKTGRALYRSLTALLCFGLAVATTGCSFLSNRNTSRTTVLSEDWYMHYIEDSSVGWSYVKVYTGGEDGSIVTTYTKSDMKVERFGISVTMESEHAFEETVDGRPLRFFHRTRMSSQDITYEGTIVDSTLKLKIVSPGHEEESVRVWNENTLFPFAAEKRLGSLSDDEGAEVELVQFLPDLNEFYLTRVRMEGKEETALLTGTERLYRYVTMVENFPALETIEWRDEEGILLKVENPFMKLASYRVPGEESVESMRTGELDILSRFLITPDRSIDDPEGLTELVLTIGFDGFQEPGVLEGIPQDRRQKVTDRDDGSVTLKLERVPLSTGGIADLPDEEELMLYRLSSTIVQSEHPEIYRKAREITAEANSPLEKACLLNRWVHEHVSIKDYTVAFASALEVFERMQGDCTEHSVLLLALARALGYPARMAIGLVSDGTIFAFHMWVEIGIEGWVPFDPTLGEEVLNATHIKLADSFADEGWLEDVIGSLFLLFSDLEVTVVSQDRG
jgi:hypothetical protein